MIVVTRLEVVVFDRFGQELLDLPFLANLNRRIDLMRIMFCRYIEGLCLSLRGIQRVDRVYETAVLAGGAVPCLKPRADIFAIDML